jgi:radical SAM protein with 4Fe4S-binding SPASM domain
MKAKIQTRIQQENRTPLQDFIPLSTPIILFIDPTSKCNFRCTFCPTGDRALIDSTERYQGLLDFDLYKKMIDDLAEFEKPIKVLRLYKDGEPFLNKRLAEMIAYAKQSGRVECIDTTTNGSLLNPERMQAVVNAGLDRINISVDGMNRAQYLKFTKFNFDFEKFVKNVTWLYENRKQMEIFIKIPGDLITESQKKLFFETFGDICDSIFIENFAPCWPEFDVEERTGIQITKGIYEQAISATEVCPYVFYSMAVNADGLVSSCFLDWRRKLVIGDARKESIKDIWNSEAMNTLRLQQLEGRRMENPICSNCGQLSHCLPDNIDQYRPQLLEKFQTHMKLELAKSRT